jgi:hypothetical protein
VHLERWIDDARDFTRAGFLGFNLQWLMMLTPKLSDGNGRLLWAYSN